MLEIKNRNEESFDGLISRWDTAEERISELEIYVNRNFQS